MTNDNSDHVLHTDNFKVLHISDAFKRFRIIFVKAMINFPIMSIIRTML